MVNPKIKKNEILGGRLSALLKDYNMVNVHDHGPSVFWPLFVLHIKKRNANKETRDGLRCTGTRTLPH
jgi:hypothetical protein